MSLEDTSHEVVIVGAGLAGLTAAFELRRCGIEPLLLEKEGDVAIPWTKRHPQLTLNTHRSLSALPDLPYPAGTKAFPKRDAVVAHLRAFRDKHRFRIAHGVELTSVSRTEGFFHLATTRGALRARHLILATGRDAVPAQPGWPGAEGFGGRIVPAAEFGDAGSYRDRSILVVGGGNSGFDVLNHLSRIETRAVWLSVRRSPALMSKRVGGFAVHRLSPLMRRLPLRVADHLIGWTQRISFGDLTKHGFPAGRSEAATRLVRHHAAIAVDDGAVAAIRRGQIRVVPEIAAFEAGDVRLRDGTVLRPDIVINATGYASALASLIPSLGPLDTPGTARLGGTSLPGLWQVGMVPSLTSYFHQARLEAKAIARAIAADPNPNR